MTEVGENTLESAPPGRRRFPPLGRRSVITLLVAGLVLLIIAGILALDKNAPPRAARLLPESDGIVYIDATPLQAALRFDTHPVKHDPDYQAFIDATGIQFERDLSQVAFALHHMANPLGPNGPVAFSSVFVGKFDRQRLAGYLAGKAQSQERYAGHDIYNIAVEGRTDRVVILDSHTVAVSNTPTAEQIHSILDRHRTAFLPFSGNSLLAQHYKDVPLFSLAWGMGKLAAGMGRLESLRFADSAQRQRYLHRFAALDRGPASPHRGDRAQRRRRNRLCRLHRGTAQRGQDRRERPAQRHHESGYEDPARQRGNPASQ